MNIITTIRYILGICLGIIILIFLEGLITLGSVFYFEHYTWLAWLAQGLMLIISICLSIIVTHEELNKNK